jgi:hypothetical protein
VVAYEGTLTLIKQGIIHQQGGLDGCFGGLLGFGDPSKGSHRVTG